MKRRLADKGKLEHIVVRSEEDVRNGLEAFLTLEASGWNAETARRWRSTASAPPSRASPFIALPSKICARPHVDA